MNLAGEGAPFRRGFFLSLGRGLCPLRPQMRGEGWRKDGAPRRGLLLRPPSPR